MTARAARPRPSAQRRTASNTPTLRVERTLLRAGHRLVAGMDEVGRGALAGPVSVGVVVVDIATGTAPRGVRDSKLLRPAVREALVPRLRRWAVSCAVGHAQPEEIDAHGIVAALRLAGHRALVALPERPDVVLLDGSHDWLTPPAPGTGPVRLPDLGGCPPVTTLVKADLRCAAVAAASVLAKVERDAVMVHRSGDHPGYGWRENKGYAAPEHSAALRSLGACSQHRRSWNLLSGDVEDDQVLDGILSVRG